MLEKTHKKKKNVELFYLLSMRNILQHNVDVFFVGSSSLQQQKKKRKPQQKHQKKPKWLQPAIRREKKDEYNKKQIKV
jgi:hypothetical protein